MHDNVLLARCALIKVSIFFQLGGGGGGVCEDHSFILYSMRPKRKRKESEEENDFQPEVHNSLLNTQ